MTSFSALSARVSRYLQRELRGDLNRLAFQLVGPFERAQARRVQDRFVGTFIGITGSVGKSTATYLTAELLATSGSVHSGLYFNTGRRSLRTLRKLKRPVDFVVQEMSGHQPGAIASATQTIRIDAAVVTTVGLDHLTEFRTREAVAAEKAKLVHALSPDGVACLNADDPLVRAMSSETTARVVLYGRAADAEVRAENVSALWPSRLSFDLVIGATRRHVQTRFVGTMPLTSTLAALAMVHALGGDLDAAIARLAELEPLANRLSVVPGSDGHDYLLDTYKASAWSTVKLVEDFANWGPGRRIFVVGHLSDTGNDGSRKYRQLLRQAALSCDLVIGIGVSASAAEKLVRNENLANVLPARDIAEARRIIAGRPPSLIILKSDPKVQLAEILPDDAQRPVGADVIRTIVR